MHTLWGEQEGIKLLSSIPRARQPPQSPPKCVCVPQNPPVFESDVLFTPAPLVLAFP